MRPGAHARQRFAVVEEGGGAVGEIEAEGVGDGETPLVPEARRDADVGALAELRDLGAGPRLLEGRDVGDEGFVGGVGAPLVGEDPGDVGVGGGLEELRLLVRRRHDAEGDDEGVLALEGFGQRGLVAVVDFLHVHA